MTSTTPCACYRAGAAAGGAAAGAKMAPRGSDGDVRDDPSWTSRPGRSGPPTAAAEAGALCQVMVTQECTFVAARAGQFALREQGNLQGYKADGATCRDARGGIGIGRCGSRGSGMYPLCIRRPPACRSVCLVPRRASIVADNLSSLRPRVSTVH